MSSDSQHRPQFIYGTAWKEERTAELTGLALETGFRAIDTANQRKHYHEAAVGEAIVDACDEGLVERDELFVQTKFTHVSAQGDHIPYDPDAAPATQVEQSFESSLDHLGVDRLDSYLLHGPSTRSGWSDVDREVWRAMEALHDDGRVDAIGVSNVTPGQLEQLVELADVAPSYVQNRCFARTGWGRETREICDSHGVRYQGFSLLTANRRALTSETIVDIADRRDRTVPQIV
ncbi:MAG: aldo/keto reductase family protein, partial [Bradymonadaceae bacterium]